MAVPEVTPTVIVTGGSGLLGSSLIESLRERYDVVSVDLDGDPNSPSEVEFICTDLTDDASVARALQRVRATRGTEIASVVHLAAFYDFAGRPSSLYEQVTIDGTRRLLDALDDFHVDQFVFSSTMLVHAPASRGEEIDEDDPIVESWPYPNSKIVTEELLRTHPTTQQMAVVVARLAGVYDDDGHSPPITNQIKRIDGRWPTSHFYPADPDCGQAFVHREDAVDALVRIVDRRRELPDPFPVLIGEPETIGYGDLQDVIAHELHGHDWTTVRIPPPIAKVGAWVREKNPFGEDPFIRSWMVDRAADHFDLDIDAARWHLGWQPSHDVVSTVPEMVGRLRDDRDAWYTRNGLSAPRRLLPA